jgi:hypothetical protein
MAYTARYGGELMIAMVAIAGLETSDRSETMKTKELIRGGQELRGAKTQWGYDIPTYDDGFGGLYVIRNSLGIVGIARAKSWEDAYSIAEDEFFPEADETVEELQREYGFRREHKRVADSDGQFVRWDTIETPDPDAWTENEIFQENYGFRPNGPNAKDTQKHGIYSKDLNGDYCDTLTPGLLAELNVTLDIVDAE